MRVIFLKSLAFVGAIACFIALTPGVYAVPGGGPTIRDSRSVSVRSVTSVTCAMVLAALVGVEPLAPDSRLALPARSPASISVAQADSWEAQIEAGLWPADIPLTTDLKSRLGTLAARRRESSSDITRLFATALRSLRMARTKHPEPSGVRPSDLAEVDPRPTRAQAQSQNAIDISAAFAALDLAFRVADRPPKKQVEPSDVAIWSALFYWARLRVSSAGILPEDILASFRVLTGVFVRWSAQRGWDPNSPESLQQLEGMFDHLVGATSRNLVLRESRRFFDRP